MEKHFEEWDGKNFPVRTVMLPQELGGYEANVADVELWNAIEEDYNNGNKEANEIDNSIYYYFDSSIIASDPTDKEIVEYLLKHGC